MSIDPFFDFKAKIENKKLIYYFTANGALITELRIVDFITKLTEILESLENDQIKQVYFIFNIDKLVIPSNFSFLKELGDCFKNKNKLLKEKLMFTIVINKSNIFHLFFSLFKQYYEPVKSLYLCKDVNEMQVCLHDEDKRSTFPNILSLINV
tara:strand:- start:373 stop:831 length:459 start_codon:yes stop_codon:yes gene_type:complete